MDQAIAHACDLFPRNRFESATDIQWDAFGCLAENQELMEDRRLRFSVRAKGLDVHSA